MITCAKCKRRVEYTPISSENTVTCGRCIQIACMTNPAEQEITPERQRLINRIAHQKRCQGGR